MSGEDRVDLIIVLRGAGNVVVEGVSPAYAADVIGDWRDWAKSDDKEPYDILPVRRDGSARSPLAAAVLMRRVVAVYASPHCGPYDCCDDEGEGWKKGVGE